MTDSISLKLAVYYLQCRIFVCLEEKKYFGMLALNSQAGKSLRVNKSRNFLLGLTVYVQKTFRLYKYFPKIKTKYYK